jgi:hypothetical protein
VKVGKKAFVRIASGIMQRSNSKKLAALGDGASLFRDRQGSTGVGRLGKKIV